ncbi:MAG: endopeptidase La [Mogibacterium sp.]|nr:endopeptidase La [Mogibacterium sp.]MBQ6389121.1 endopeptidase La [Mogibacterium sp.]
MPEIQTTYTETPYIPLRGQAFFPGTIVGFDIGRDKSLAAVDHAMNGDKYLVVSAQRDTTVNEPVQSDCYLTGALIKVRQVVKKNDEFVRILVVVESRVRISSIYQRGNMLVCDSTVAEDYDNDPEDINLQANVRVLKQIYVKYLDLNGQGEAGGRNLIDGIDDAALLCSLIANEVDVAYDIKQTLLEIDSVKLRVGHLIDIIGKENNILSIAKRINNRVVKNMNRGQREYYLREQLQVIKEELGEDEDIDDEARAWKEKLDGLKLSEKVDTKIRKEIDKFAKMNPMSPDANVSRTYIETILDLPWHESSKVNNNIKRAEKILNEDHYGLEKVKERILENLAVQHLTKDNKGPIICLVGPPGVGKTSIARSIARATGREFVRMSLGGVRDEAEIRGHRRTYIGAIPGRVINNIIEAGTNNPLFLFDEVDKIGSDFRGDPASALLEVLDPEQNSTFTDHYLEVPFDLSKVMFITTANTTATIPRPLLDRMEVIELSSYTEEEKVRIAMDYLVPKKIRENGIRKNQFTINEAAIREIIEYYTREAGVRNLEREIGNACRRAARNIVDGSNRKNNVTPRNITKYIGKRIFIEDIGSLEPEVGVTTGMAWTTVGGVTLTIETVKMPGSGRLVLTGQMGEVMRESAQTALGYIKSISSKYKISKDIFKDYDIQIHIPEGATPKDGPSAGITMCSALFSLLTDRKADKTVAMTGEITLRGKVLRIGGLKEKSLAAYRQGIRKIIIPKENIPDLEDIPASVRKKIEFVPVESFEEVIPIVIL